MPLEKFGMADAVKGKLEWWTGDTAASAATKVPLRKAPVSRFINLLSFGATIPQPLADNVSGRSEGRCTSEQPTVEVFTDPQAAMYAAHWCSQHLGRFVAQM